eukprot:9056556-Alexandrium_andersonii.AAC.1
MGRRFFLQATSWLAKSAHHAAIKSSVHAVDLHGAWATTTRLRKHEAAIPTASARGEMWMGWTAPGEM